MVTGLETVFISERILLDRAQTDLEFTAILLPQPPKHWIFMFLSMFSNYFVSRTGLLDQGRGST